MTKPIIIGVLVAFVMIGSYAALQVSDNGFLRGGGESFRARGCAVNTVTQAIIGPDISSTLLSASSVRAWARIQQTDNASTTSHLSFDEGAAAVVGAGLVLGPDIAGASTTPNFIDFGLNTDFPYTGAVTGITDLSSTTVLVTECRY